MAAKKIWMSMLSKDETNAQRVMGEIKKYGLAIDGHFWSINLEKMEWAGPRDELLDPNCGLWLIVGTADDFAAKEVRFGLSLLALMIQAKRGNGFPIMVLHPENQKVEAESLPTPLQHAQVHPANSAFGPKLVARANMPAKNAEADYRFDVYGLPGLGLWLEVGPAKTPWKGVMLGAHDGEVNAHGVAPKGQLPGGKMILEYQMKGLKLNLGDKEYVAWAVQNELDLDTSYFVRVGGTPDSLMFGELPSEDEGEVFVLNLI